MTFDEIRKYNRESFSTRLVDKAEKQTKVGSTFLSYSTRDDEFLPSIIGFLEQNGATVYLDKKDESIVVINRSQDDARWGELLMGDGVGNAESINVGKLQMYFYYLHPSSWLWNTY